MQEGEVQPILLLPGAPRLIAPLSCRCPPRALLAGRATPRHRRSRSQLDCVFPRDVFGEHTHLRLGHTPDPPSRGPLRLSGFAGGDILFRPGIPHSSIATDVLRQVTHDHFDSQRNHGVRIMERKLALRKAAALYGGHLRQDGANTPVVSLAGGQEPHRVSSGALSGKSVWASTKFVTQLPLEERR